MFEDFSLKLSLYLIPTSFILGGVRLTQIEDWFWGGVLVIVLGFGIALHIGIAGIIREQNRNIREKSDYYDSMLRFYRHVENMSSENKYIFGLTYASPDVKITIDKTKQVGNEFSQTWQKLPATPYKLKVIAQAAINGERFTFRKWAGKGKLLAPSEWEALKDAMLKAGLIEQANDEAAQQGFNWSGLGIDVMEQVVRDGIGKQDAQV